MTITVRALGGTEWRLYRAVRLAALADAPWAFGSTLARETDFSDARWRERLAGGNVFLAERAGEPGGLVGVLPDGDGSGDVVSMWVAPRARGTGVADRLVARALDRAVELDIAPLRLWVTDGNTAAERLYARHGFTRTGAAGPRPQGDAAEFEMAATPRQVRR